MGDRKSKPESKTEVDLAFVSTEDLINELLQRGNCTVVLMDYEGAEVEENDNVLRQMFYTEWQTVGAYGLLLWAARQLRKDIDA